MAAPANDLETALTSAGFAPESAAELGKVLKEFVDDAVSRRSSSQSEPLESLMSDPNAERLIRVEQSLLDLRELMQVRFDAVDKQFEAVDRRFEEIDRRLDVIDARLEELSRRLDLVERRLDVVERRLDELDSRMNRERVERIGFVTAATGAIVAGLLRLFGAI